MDHLGGGTTVTMPEFSTGATQTNSSSVPKTRRQLVTPFLSLREATVLASVATKADFLLGETKREAEVGVPIRLATQSYFPASSSCMAEAKKLTTHNDNRVSATKKLMTRMDSFFLFEF